VGCDPGSGTAIFVKNGGYPQSVNIKNFCFTIAIIRPIRYNSKDNRVVMRIARKRAVTTKEKRAVYG
jgi:hypothetical protein